MRREEERARPLDAICVQMPARLTQEGPHWTREVLASAVGGVHATWFIAYVISWLAAGASQGCLMTYFNIHHITLVRFLRTVLLSLRSRVYPAIRVRVFLPRKFGTKMVAPCGAGAAGHVSEE